MLSIVLLIDSVSISSFIMFFQDTSYSVLVTSGNGDIRYPQLTLDLTMANSSKARLMAGLLLSQTRVTMLQLALLLISQKYLSLSCIFSTIYILVESLQTSCFRCRVYALSSSFRKNSYLFYLTAQMMLEEFSLMISSDLQNTIDSLEVLEYLFKIFGSIPITTNRKVGENKQLKNNEIMQRQPKNTLSNYCLYYSILCHMAFTKLNLSSGWVCISMYPFEMDLYLQVCSGKDLNTSGRSGYFNNSSYSFFILQYEIDSYCSYWLCISYFMCYLMHQTKVYLKLFEGIFIRREARVDIRVFSSMISVLGFTFKIASLSLMTPLGIPSSFSAKQYSFPPVIDAQRCAQNILRLTNTYPLILGRLGFLPMVENDKLSISICNNIINIMLDKLSDFFSERFPEYNKRKQNRKKQESVAIMRKYKANEPISNAEQKLILDMLHAKNKLPITEDSMKQEKDFYKENFKAILNGSVATLFPLLVREFHNYTAFKRSLIMLSIFTSVYSLTLYPAYSRYGAYRNQLFQQNASKLYD